MSQLDEINQQLQAAANTANAAAQIMHDFANGDEATTVQTESGELPSLANYLKQIGINEIDGGQY